MIHWKIDDGIGVVTFDSPHGNMLTLNDLQSFNKILSELSPNVEALLLEGSNHAFCTGVKVDSSEVAKTFEQLDCLLLQLYNLKIPVSIALQGHAIGAGFLFLCCADYVYSVGSERMKFGLPEVKLALGVDELMINLLHSTLPLSIMEPLISMGEYVNYRKMIEWKLIDEITVDSPQEKCIIWMKERIRYKQSFCFCKQIMRKDACMKMAEAYRQSCYLELVGLFHR